MFFFLLLFTKLESNCVGQLLWLICPVPLHGRKFIFLSHQVSNSFLVRGETLCPFLYPSSHRDFVWLELVYNCGCWQSLWACMCVCPFTPVTLFHWSHPPLPVLTIFHTDPWALRGGVWWRHPNSDRVLQSLSLSAHCPAMGLCASAHTLQEVMSLMRTDKVLIYSLLFEKEFLWAQITSEHPRWWWCTLSLGSVV